MNDRQHTALRTLLVRILLALPLLASQRLHAQDDLQITYGSKGIQRLTYRGVTLEDQAAFSSDAFHIWHLKSTDLDGKVISTGQYGWGETNSGEAWDPTSHTETYTFSWGSISTQFVQHGNNLDMFVTETNNANSGILFDGAEIYPFALHFPIEPVGFYGYSQYAITTTGPGVSVADFGSGTVTSVIPNESVAMYGGWKNAGNQVYTPLMTSTAPDGLATFLPHNDVPVRPGSSFSYVVSVRFTPEGVAADASDAYTSFASTYPSQMTWSDKRMIGTAYLASSPSNADITQPGGFPTNPRRYFNDASVDITSPKGLRAFQNRVLAQAQANVNNARGLNGQGVITWDIEGEQYPQSTSYVCSPDQIGSIAPEMESTITDTGSAYYGQKLDDAYFKTMTDAGVKVGVCLRPQAFTASSNGTASQIDLGSDAAITQNLELKARYATSRWGATIFYVDSSVYADGGTLNPAIFQQLITDMPNVLFIPEESTPRYYAYSAPFYSFLFHTDLGTPPAIYKIYPGAFGANLVNDVSPLLLAANLLPLTESVIHGDILMGHADYWQANNAVLLAIYAAAGLHGGGPVQGTPAISWSPLSLQYGAALSSAQLDATANIPGTFVYNPPAGVVPSAGTTTLQTTFTPADSVNYKSVVTVSSVIVEKATPAIVWTPSSAVQAGTALSPAQLNATSSVPGTFRYSPAAGTILSAGTYQLQATFTPTDESDYNSATASVPLLVRSSVMRTPVVSWPAARSIVYGTPLSGLQLNAKANVAGRFDYSPSFGATLNAGAETLQVTFTPDDSANYAPATLTSRIFVSKAVPVITWKTPASITKGTVLSGAQLNALADLPGSFVYTPAAGTALDVGTTTLQAVFTPSDTMNVMSGVATVGLTVKPAAPAEVNLAILWPGPGATLSGTVSIDGFVNLYLDSAGTFLTVDGQEIGTHRVLSAPFLYQLDTTTLTNGNHVLQLWGHDIGNNTTLSEPVSVTVLN